MLVVFMSRFLLSVVVYVDKRERERGRNVV